MPPRRTFLTPTLTALFLYAIFTAEVTAETLARLFFTPAERAQLEENQSPLHHQNKARTPAAASTINGLIQTTDGHRTIWINGKSKRETVAEKEADMPLFIPIGKSSHRLSIKRGTNFSSQPNNTLDLPAHDKND